MPCPPACLPSPPFLSPALLYVRRRQAQKEVAMTAALVIVVVSAACWIRRRVQQVAKLLVVASWTCVAYDVVVCRKVALSEGRVHDGTLECAYHGWEFDGSGKLVVIPQASSSACYLVIYTALGIISARYVVLVLATFCCCVMYDDEIT